MIENSRRIMRDLNIISRCLYNIREAQFKKFGLTRAQHTFLSRIQENEGINQEDLSFLLKMDKTTTSKGLKKLEALGLIKRVRSKTNHRSWELYTTEAFNVKRTALDEVINSSVDFEFLELSNDELDQLDSLLQKVKTQVFKEWEQMKKNEL